MKQFHRYAALFFTLLLASACAQQLAGLIMWLPGGVVFTLLTIGYFAAWLSALEQRSGQLQHSDFLRSRQQIE